MMWNTRIKAVAVSFLEDHRLVSDPHFQFAFKYEPVGFARMRLHPVFGSF